MRRSHLSEVARVALAAAALGAIYVAVLALFIPLNGLWSGDQGAKLVQIFSLLSNRFRSGALIYPAQALDPERALSPLPALFSTFKDGEHYSIFSYPYAALTAVPFFFLGYPGLYLIPVVATVATAVLLALIGRQLGLARWWLLVPLAGLATPLSFYALVLWEHALAVCCAVAAVLLALQALEHKGWRLAFVAGCLGGLGYWMRAELLWFAPALLVGMAWAGAGRRLLGATVLGFAIPISLSLGTNLLAFGQPLGPQVAANYAPLSVGGFLSNRSAIVGVMLLDPAGRQLLPALALALALAVAALPQWRPLLLLALALISLLILAREGVVLHTGLAGAAPLALAGLAAFSLRERPAVRLLLGVALLFAGGVLLTAPNDGGVQWSPRYLLLSGALLLPLAILAATRTQSRLWSAALALLVLAGLSSTIMSVLLLQRSTHDTLRILQVVNAQPDQPVLTDIWYGPQLLGPLFLERDLLFIDGPTHLGEARDRLRRAGVAQISYLTAQPWQRDTVLPPELGIDCRRVEGFAYNLTLLDCSLGAAP